MADLVVDGKAVTTTKDHPFWNDTDREWQRADALGDHILRSDGRHAKVDGLRIGPVFPALADNLTVDDIHTYYVLAGNVAVLVHNTCPGMEDLGNLRTELGSPAPDEVVLSRLDAGGQQFYGISGHGQSYPRPAGVTPQSMTHAEGDAFGQAARAGVNGGHGTLYVDGLVPCRYCRSSFAGYAKSLDWKPLRLSARTGT